MLETDLVSRLLSLSLIVGISTFQFFFHPVDAKECVCSSSYDPVCGTDGYSYLSLCVLECAAENGDPVKEANKGRCDLDKVAQTGHAPTVPVDTIDCVCSKLSNPVCGSDGKTYQNPCLLTCQTADVIVKSTGPCQPKRIAGKMSQAVLITKGDAKECVCSMQYDPVCGTDGHNYSNMCVLDCAAVNGYPVRMASKGRCGVDYVDEPGRAPSVPLDTIDCICSKTSNPVCGSDGKTYLNPCIITCQAADIRIQGRGPCPPKRMAGRLNKAVIISHAIDPNRCVCSKINKDFMRIEY